MHRQLRLGFVPGLVAATLLAWGCDRPVTPAGPKPSYSTGGSATCGAGGKFTGGGRIDPPGGNTTFGFNVDASDACSSGGPINGQLQTVWHPPHTLIHSLTIDDFFSYFDPERGGPCAFFGGTARVKIGNGNWEEKPFGAVACDNGEPGSSPGRGPDSYGISVVGVGETGVPDLTGGNIQAH